MINEEEHRIIGMIYEAILNHSWGAVLAEIAKYTNSYSSVFISSDQLNPNTNFLHVHNLSETFISTYQAEELRLLDMRIHQPRLQQGGGIGCAVDIDWAMFDEMHGTGEQFFYKNCLQPNGLQYAAGVLLDAGQYQWGLLAIHRTGNMHRYGPQERKILEYFSIHLKRALHIHRQFNIIHQKQDTLNKILDNLNTGVMVVNSNSKLIYANVIARNILEKFYKLMWVDRFNKIKTKACFQNQLNHYISNVFLDCVNSENINEKLVLYEVPNLPLIKLSIEPLSKVSMLSGAPQKEEKAIIFIKTVQEHYQLSEKHLSKSYGLTKREISICKLLVNGRSLEEMAEELSITLSSIRTYFKYIYEKTNCSAQIELMYMLMKSAKI